MSRHPKFILAISLLANMVFLALHFVHKTQIFEEVILVTKKEKSHTDNRFTKQRDPSEVCEKRLPEAIIVGSQKSGTSALITFLDKHSNIAGCLHPPEPRYFSMYYEKHTLDWYKNLMPCSFKNQITIEKTPEYFYMEKIAKRIYNYNPKTKIMVILKDPVDVAVSIYMMWKRDNSDRTKGKRFRDIITKTVNNKTMIDPESRIIMLCTYSIHMRLYIDIFGSDQVLAIDGNKYEEDPASELEKVENFLGIPHEFTPESFVFNDEKQKPCFKKQDGEMECLSEKKGHLHFEIAPDLKIMLREYLRPFNMELNSMLNRKFIWS